MTREPERRALVTGGTGGLGRAIVARLCEDGFDVVAADLVPQRSGPVSALVDVTDSLSVGKLVADRGPFEVLVNNAGIAGPSAAVEHYPVAAWRRVLEVNLTGAFLCIQACLPAMLEAEHGRIVNIASIAGKDGNPMMSAYSAAKGGLIALTKSAAKEHARSGVLINCVVPGVIAAGLTDHASDQERALFLSRVPMGRMGRPEELAEVVSFLSSSRCSFSTGATFDLSGGRAVY